MRLSWRALAGAGPSPILVKSRPGMSHGCGLSALISMKSQISGRPNGAGPYFAETGRKTGPVGAQIRRHLGRRHRPHPQRRGPREARGRRRPRLRGRGLGHGRGHQSARRPGSSRPGASRSGSSNDGRELSAQYDCKRIRRGGGLGRAGDLGAARTRAAVDRHQGALLAGLADPAPYRRRASRGPHHRARRRRAQGAHARRRGGGGRGLPGHRAGQPHLDAWAGAARTRARWRLPRRCTPIAATSIPMSTASTRPTRGSCPRRTGSTASPTKRCWKWPRKAPRCCRRARSSSPCRGACACWCARASIRLTSAARRPTMRVESLEHSFAMRMRSWSKTLSVALPMRGTRPR